MEAIGSDLQHSGRKYCPLTSLSLCLILSPPQENQSQGIIEIV